MPDLQNRHEDYWFALDQVGLSSVKHPVLKRPDEKPVTERACENPRFAVICTPYTIIKLKTYFTATIINRTPFINPYFK